MEHGPPFQSVAHVRGREVHSVAGPYIRQILNEMGETVHPVIRATERGGNHLVEGQRQLTWNAY